MRTYTKRIRVIEMTSEEIEKFHKLVAQAAEGQTVHAAEARLDDGSFLAVSVNDSYKDAAIGEAYAGGKMPRRPKY